MTQNTVSLVVRIEHWILQLMHDSLVLIPSYAIHFCDIGLLC